VTGKFSQFLGGRICDNRAWLTLVEKGFNWLELTANSCDPNQMLSALVTQPTSSPQRTHTDQVLPLQRREEITNREGIPSRNAVNETSKRRYIVFALAKSARDQ
jgi:hypothetical protein